jgi:hypothetical protein
MKKKDIIQLVKKIVKENNPHPTFYGNREQPSTLGSTSAIAPAGKDPYTGKNEYPHSVRPKRTGSGYMQENESTSFKVVNADTGKTIDFGLDQAKAEEIVAAAKEDNINAKVVKMKDEDDVGTLKEFTSMGQEGIYPRREEPGDMFQQKEVEELLPNGMASRDDRAFQDRLKQHADWTEESGYNNTFVHIQYHDSFDREHSYRIHQSQNYNGNYKDFRNPKFTVLTITKTKDGKEEELGKYIVDTDAYLKDFAKLRNDGVLGKQVSENKNKELTDNPKLQPGKTVTYSGTRYEVIENSGYVLTLKSLESGNELKLNLGQLKDRPIKENNMKKNIKEADLYTLTSTDGEEKQVSFPDQNTAMAAASKNANVKQVVKLEGEDDSDLEQIQKGKMVQLNKYFEDIGKMKLGDGTIDVGYAKMDLVPGVKENTPDEDEDENQSQDDIARGVDDAKDFMEAYIKERGDDNLMEHMDKYRKRATLMEGATEKLFKLFNAGKTDLEVRSHYLQMNVDMPESFIAKLRNNWESLRKTKLDLTLADKEAEGFEPIQQATPANGMEGGEIDGMEETKELASGLFTK